MSGNRMGLMHLMPLMVGCVVPDPLLSLPFKMVVVELSDEVCNSFHFVAVSLI